MDLDCSNPFCRFPVGSFTSNDTNHYNIDTYRSGEIHFVTVKGLKPSTKYYYVCGDQAELSKEYSFVTPHNKPTKVSFGLIGDIGQTSKDTCACTMSKLLNFVQF
eukprot:TRINITY_DN2525_c0_g1_i3.p2 TRINITY_DN2525_c0_g1~~TRINITY_DN2525_c0_g1_i3.p2  ORF type:complete len:105 (+),score=16.97 TRINITY_DN2525_c0_g1_i3:280-594(+)